MSDSEIFEDEIDQPIPQLVPIHFICEEREDYEETKSNENIDSDVETSNSDDSLAKVEWKQSTIVSEFEDEDQSIHFIISENEDYYEETQSYKNIIDLHVKTSNSDDSLRKIERKKSTIVSESEDEDQSIYFITSENIDDYEETQSYKSIIDSDVKTSNSDDSLTKVGRKMSTIVSESEDEDQSIHFITSENIDDYEETQSYKSIIDSEVKTSNSDDSLTKVGRKMSTIVSESEDEDQSIHFITSENIDDYEETHSYKSIIDSDVKTSNRQVEMKKSTIVSESEDEDQSIHFIISENEEDYEETQSNESIIDSDVKTSNSDDSITNVQRKKSRVVSESEDEDQSIHFIISENEEGYKETQSYKSIIDSHVKTSNINDSLTNVQRKKSESEGEDHNPDEMVPVNYLITKKQQDNPQVLYNSLRKLQIKKNRIKESDSDEETRICPCDFEDCNIASPDIFKVATNKLIFLDQKPVTQKILETGKGLLNKSLKTPKTFKQIKDRPNQVSPNSLISSEESNGPTDNIKDISDEEPSTSFKTAKVKKDQVENVIEKKIKQSKPNFIEREYQDQSDKVENVQFEYEKDNNLLSKINLEHLPDKDDSLKNAETLQKACLNEVVCSKMQIVNKNLTKPENKIISWNHIEAAACAVIPRTSGKQALGNINTERQITVDSLKQLHGSLQICPKESDLAEQPEGLKVELMVHQKRALSWLIWREQQKPSGGILADDMGLGKTLTMISLVIMCNSLNLNNNDEEKENQLEKNTKFNGGTLVVCPASLINLWSVELEHRTKTGLISCELYHGAKREIKPKILAQHDMVITTYSVVSNEYKKNGAIFKIKWRRLIIDEAHQIRNHNSIKSDAVCQLSAKSRWALSGTLVQNKELDMYSLMKFLRCSPFDDIKFWKRWVDEKSTGGGEQLHTVISSLMLRRTKVELMEKGLLNTMPERKWQLIEINLTKSERGIYSKFLIFSRTLFAQFLHQRAETNQDALDANCNVNSATGPNQEYFLMRQKLLRMNKLKDIKQHEILVLLLRLRQICCHLSLISGMFQEDNDMQLLTNEEEDADKSSAIDLLDQLNKLTLIDENDPGSVAKDLSEETSNLKDVAKSVLKPSDPIFSKTLMSSKIKALINLLKEKIVPTNDKAIIVSQWTSFLNLIGYHLKEERLKFEQLDGQVPVHKRMEKVDRLNNPEDPIKVLLLSLAAGGLGLSLVGANHLVLLDLHWNPQLENQAQERIYRIGQEKPVFIYKFLAIDTIEKRILDLQEKKLNIANSMFMGSNQANKNQLSLQDLKMLFEM